VDVALLLLLSHAIAKALLATSAGSVIATTSDQNITEMGGLWSRMPATTTGFVVGSLSLVSLLPMGMFWTLRRWVDGFWDAPLWLLILVALVNALSAINLVRVFRLVFLGPAQAKTRRAPEVPWPMAVPMVALIVVNLLLPLMLQRWQLLITWASPLVGGNFASEWGEWVLLASGLLGLAVGALLPLRSRGASRPMEQPLNPLQALFAYDFYIDRIYRATVVALVNAVSRIASWTDRYVVDGLANAIGFGTLFGGQSLKYSATGQSQAYVVTILVGLGALLAITFGLRDLWTEVTDTLQIFLAFSP
jgi:NAD(P)H-quinone oxidoreductase subunit 5